MRASLERTGGFAGIRTTTAVDAAALPSDDSKLLRKLIEQADFYRLPETIVDPKLQTDRFQFKLTIEDGLRKHSVTVAESAIPANLRPLVDWLLRQPRH